MRTVCIPGARRKRSSHPDSELTVKTTVKAVAKSPRYLAAAFLFAFLSGTGSLAQLTQPLVAARDLEVVRVRPNVYMIAGAGANITVHIGSEGILLVDTGSAEASDKVLAAIGKLTDQRIRYIFNTSGDADHMGGNARLARAGLTLLPTSGTGGAEGTRDAASNNGGAAVLAHDNVMSRLIAAPESSWPSETFTGTGRSLYLNNDGVQMIHLLAAHSDADSIVAFRRADVIATGAIVDLQRFPVIDTKTGGTIRGELAALNRLMDMAIPAVPLAWLEGRTLLIPAYGRVFDQADLVEYRDMVTIVRDRINSMMKEGMALDQIKKGNPTVGYRKRYGADSGPWTTDMFVEAIYNGLTAKPK